VSFAGDRLSYLELAQLLEQLLSAKVAAIGLALPLDHSQTSLDDEAQARLRAVLVKPSDAPLLAKFDPDLALWAALSSRKGTVLAAPAGMKALPTLALEAPDNLLAWLLPALSPPSSASAPIIATPALAMFTEQATPAVMTMGESVVAAIPLVVAADGQHHPAFELAVASRALGVPLDALRVHPGKGLAVGTAWYATDAGLRVYPQVRDRSRPLLHLNVQDILHNPQTKKQLRGKAVLVAMANGPLAEMVQVPGGLSVSRLDWSAQAVDAIINESFVNVPYWSLGAQRAVLVILTIYFLLLPFRLRGNLGLFIGLGLVFLLLNGNLLLMIAHNTWLPLGLPVVLLLLGHSLLWLHHRANRHCAGLRSERDRALIELASNLRTQGQLDQAMARLSECGTSLQVQEALYQLGLDFERRRQFNKALVAYERIAKQNDNFRDIRERLARHTPGVEPPSLAATTVSYAATKLVVDDPKVARPVLGRYEIESELGRGAMGTVYLGRDPRISRTVAIKTLALTEEFESEQLEEVRRRFFQEAETAGRLNHPNIVTIYDVGEEHDLAYIAMDYITGDSLDQHVREEELLPIDQVFAIGIQVAEALGYAHEQKVVHRDVKPGNIIYDHDKGQLKVTDFGIACLTDNSKTRTGTVLGSPFYMSPEQIAGKKVDGRSDLFSLGVTLYQLFSGRLPFEGDSLTNLMYQITNEKPRGIRKIRPELPACLTRLINKALDKDPGKRFDDGQAMADALRRCAEKM
jgi:serine/threonine-protein kinase